MGTLHFLNEQARQYHLALQHTNNILYRLECAELFSGSMVGTTEALATLTEAGYEVSATGLRGAQAALLDLPLLDAASAHALALEHLMRQV